MNNNHSAVFNAFSLFTYLEKIGYISIIELEQNQLDILESLSINILEKNENINPNSANDKYREIMASLNEKFSTDLEIFELYSLYKKDFSSNIAFDQFINWIILLNLILTKFNDNLLHYDFDLLFAEQVTIIQIDSLSYSSQLNNKYKKIYNYNNNEVLELDPNDKLLVMVYLFSFCDNFRITRNLTLDDYVHNCSVYNKMYISHSNFCLMHFIEMYIFFKLFEQSPKSSISDNINAKNNNEIKKTNNDDINNNSTKNNKLGKSNDDLKNDKINDVNINIKSKEPSSCNLLDSSNFNTIKVENFYLLDNESINFNNDDIVINCLIFQGYFKFFAFLLMSKINIKLTINLTIENPILLTKSNINNNILITNNSNNNNIYIDTENNYNETVMNTNSNTNMSIFPFIDMIMSAIKLENYKIFTKEKIITAFKSFNFKNLIIEIVEFSSLDEITTLLKLYECLLIKCENFYLQEPISYYNNTYLNLNTIFLDWKILDYFLVLLSKKRTTKDGKLKNLSLKLSACKCTINQSINQNKEVNLFFNYSCIREKTLSDYFANVTNVIDFINKQKGIILKLELYKSFQNINLRLYQNNFRLTKLIFVCSIITKIIVNFANEIQNLKNLKIIEQTLPSYQPNMQCIIIDEYEKKKNVVSKLKECLNKFPYNLSYLKSYTEDLVEYFDYIVFCEDNKCFNKLRITSDNRLFLLYNNSLDDLNRNNNNSIENILQKNDENSNYLNAFVYLISQRDLIDNVFNLLCDLKNTVENTNVKNITLTITLTCDRYFLENQILMDPKYKQLSKIIYQICDYFYLISKLTVKKSKSKCNNNTDNNNKNDNSSNIYGEEINNDIYIGENYVGICDYKKYGNKGDEAYNNLIIDYISLLSSNIEFILHILKKKNIYMPRFVYIKRFLEEKYFSVEYKESNIFFREVKRFESFSTFAVKSDYPLVCLLSKKTKTDYVSTTDNFYDIFLRLFLNLHRIVDENNTMNNLFLEKIHKNIFYQYYDSFYPIFFNYNPFIVFTEFMTNNHYLDISKNDKFNVCYLVPFEKFNYKKHISIFKSENLYLCKELIIFYFNFTHEFFFKSPLYSNLSFKKVDTIIEKIKDFHLLINKNNVRKSMFILSKKITNKKILDIIFSFYFKYKHITIFTMDKKIYSNIYDDYMEEKKKIKEQKIELRVVKLTENPNPGNKKEYTNKSSKDNCLIY